MENETQNQTTKDSLTVEPPKRDNLLPASIFIAATILAGAWVYSTGSKGVDVPKKTTAAADSGKTQTAALEAKVLPSEGVVLPVRWGDLGAKMVSAGVIDEKKFGQLYASRGGLTDEMKSLLSGESNGNLKITSENSGMILNLLWAAGLGTKNDILDSGPMMDKNYGDAGNFASTGGWSLAQGEAMTHYSRHPFVILTPEQQQRVERVSKNIYRPCCNNATYFPDCNHGMAMLGLLEIMASQGVSEEEMYKAALQVNAYWFPDTYLTIAKYLESKGIGWEEADPQEVLGVNYSSGSGYQKILSQVAPPSEKTSGSCGV